MTARAPGIVDDTRLGALLLENPVMREEDLQRCLEIQALTGNSRPLGQILVEEGVVTQEMLEELLRVQAARRAAGPLRTDNAKLITESILDDAIAAGATDVIVSEGRPVLLRVGGVLRRFSEQELAPNEVWDFVRTMLGDRALDELAEKKTLHGDVWCEGVMRGRVSAFRHSDGIAVFVRLHPARVRAFADSGLPPGLLGALQPGKGLLLVAGETRCGVTETLALLVEELSKEKNRIVLVLDDGNEIPTPVGGAVVIRRHVGATQYARALAIAVREGPDVIVAGDVGDPQAFDIALRAAESGRLVIAGLRARSTTFALQRVLAGYRAQDLPRVRTTLASLLLGVVALQLLPDAAQQKQLLATEMLVVGDAVREVVREGNLAQLGLLLRQGREYGHSMDGTLLKLLKAGQIRFDDAFARADDKTQILQAARHREATRVLGEIEAKS